MRISDWSSDVCSADLLKPGASYTIRLWGVGAYFSKAFAMPNAYLAARGLDARTIAATRPVVDSDTGLETLPFVAPMTDEAKLATQRPPDRPRWLTPSTAFLVQAERRAPVARGVVILPTPVVPAPPRTPPTAGNARAPPPPAAVPAPPTTHPT